MPSIELTETLRSTIKELRKTKKKRSDELSKELGKGAAYISQIESGKIKEIDFELLEEIFIKINDLPENQYNDFFNNLMDNVTSHLTKEELQHEKWMHQFNHEIRKFPINDNIIEFIKTKLHELNYSPEEFIDIINQNRGLNGIEIQETNKLQIKIIDTGNGSYGILSSIRFKFETDFLSKILSKEITTISYINMEGILFNLFLSDNCSLAEAHEKTDQLLYDNQFYTIQERNKIIRKNIEDKQNNNETFTFYYIQPTDYDKKYTKLKKDIDSGFNYLRDKNIVYTCERLEILSQNMHDDLGLMIAVMSVPLFKIHPSLKKDFWLDYQNLIKNYIEKTDTNND